MCKGTDYYSNYQTFRRFFTCFQTFIINWIHKNWLQFLISSETATNESMGRMIISSVSPYFPDSKWIIPTALHSSWCLPLLRRCRWIGGGGAVLQIIVALIGVSNHIRQERYVKHHKRPKKHQKICLALNVTISVERQRQHECWRLPKRESSYNLFFSALPAPVPLYFDGVTLNL